MKIKINGIFGKYSHEVDLSLKCVILIGENGIGKSTTMNIIHNILNGKFEELPKYSFSSIDIISDNNTIHLDYADLFPTIDKLIELNKEDINNSLSDLSDAMSIIQSNKQIHNELIRSYILNQVDADNWPSKIKKVLLSNNSNYANNLKSFTILFNYLFRKDCTIGEYNGITYYNNSTFSNNSMYKDIYLMLKDRLKRALKISMFNKVSIDNRIYNVSPTEFITINKECSALGDEYNKFLENNEIYQKRIKTAQTLGIDVKETDKWFNNDNLEYEMLPLFKKLFSKFSVDEVNSWTNIIKWKYDVYKDILDNGVLNVSKLLLSNFYSQDMILEFTHDYYEMIKKAVNHEYSDEELELKKYYDDYETLTKVKLFLMPLIPINSPFSNFAFKTEIDKYEDKAFNKFLLDHLDKYVNYECPKIKKLNDLFSKYFKNKKIYCSPSKIIISMSSEKDYLEDIDIRFLSEGEKRIIILFLVSVLNENNTLLIDEPETSLSITWQESLINDLLNSSTFNNLIVATQSPYIVQDNNLLDYLECLLGDDE